MFQQILITTMIFMIATSGCSQQDTSAETLPDGVDITASSVERELHPDVTESERTNLEQGNSAFALDLYRHLRAGDEGEENLFFSPHSISIAFAMTYAGAEGETERQMAEVMHYDLPEPELHEAFNELDLILASRTNRLDVVNATWGQRSWHFLPDYLDILSLNYGAAMYLMDFASDPESSRTTINDWVADQTEDRIEDLLQPSDITSNTVLVLTNAIYFDAPWQIPFDADATVSANFTRNDNTVVTVDMMQRVEELNYSSGPDWTAAELPYENEEISMVVLLPAADRPNLDHTLDAESLEAILNSLTPTEDVQLSMPRFSFGAEIDLSDSLYAMGMIDAFSPMSADFRGIDGTRALYISAARHKAWIDVTERGTEAAAATAVVASFRAAPVVNLNRPFLFLIRDIETGAILFLGRVADPTAA